MKPYRLMTRNDIKLWALSLPGRPRVKVIEYQTHDFGRLVIQYHRNHRRRFKLPWLKAAVAAGTKLELREVSHASLKYTWEFQSL